ncbi:MAG TPA: alpha-hydroxy acid oxidase [Acidimicrobiales bacterium]|nr:alpha-hydroxy acid oxidase [Acidimicrobiales bacterium]
MATDLPWDPDELAALARERLTREAATYYETTAVFPPTRDNERAWAMWRFVPRFGIDVSQVSTATSFFGREVPAPVLLAPCAFGGYAHPDGEWAVARGAARTGTPYVVSSASTQPQVSVPSAATTPCWCQVYVPHTDAEVDAIVRGAEDSGFAAIVVTVDAPIGSLRRRGYIPDADEHDPFEHARPSGSPLNPAVTWATLERIAGLTSLPVLVKGVLSASDAETAVAHGVRGVVVSNHGSRQLDGVVPTAAVIEEVAAAVGGRAVVLVDGGVRSGRDVLRALCLGADGVLVGRPYLWALAVAGEDGVDLLLRRYQLELENAMALTGCCTVADAGRALLRWYPYPSG